MKTALTEFVEQLKKQLGGLIDVDKVDSFAAPYKERELDQITQAFEYCEHWGGTSDEYIKEQYNL